MSVITNESRVRAKVRATHGFQVYTLSNNKLQIAVVPELGAKIISLKNLRLTANGCGIPATN